MKSQTIFSFLVILLFAFQIVPGQEPLENENWIGVIEGGQPPFLRHNFKNYNSEDVGKAKEKLKFIRQSANRDEWEGTYSLFGELSDMRLLWNSDAGFINYYIYTCMIELRSLNYGKAINNPDSVILLTEKLQPPFFGTGKTGQEKMIKVKWGERHYLIEEKDLETFCELAAGYYGGGKNEEIEFNGETFVAQISIWNSFWVKSDDYQKKKVFGLPVLPKAYEKLIKFPIETEIISVGKYEKDKITDQPILFYSRRFVTIGKGKRAGIKPQMQFYVPELDELITITQVEEKTATAVLERTLDDQTGDEGCGTSDEASPCLPIKTGMKIKTVPNEFLED